MGLERKHDDDTGHVEIVNRNCNFSDAQDYRSQKLKISFRQRPGSPRKAIRLEV